jgi:hypothetical protein
MSTIDVRSKLKIIGLDPSVQTVTVEANFNPKEIQLDKSVPWQKQKKAKGAADLEFTGAEPRTMSLELMFDGFETNASVQPQIDMLHQLSDIDTSLKRPPKVKVIWGTDKESGSGALPKFEAVIESVSIKYTMFSSDGQVLRATANVKLKQAADLKVGKPQGT